MKRFLNYFTLPITAGVVVILLYGGLGFVDLKIKNQNLEQKQNQLETKIALLETNFQSVNSATESDEKPRVEKVLAATTDSEKIVNSTPEPLPAPSPTKKETVTPTTPAPTPTMNPSPTSTPTTTPTPVAQASVKIENVGDFTVEILPDDTAFSILLRAGQENGFTIEYQTYEGLGAFVTCIAGTCAHDNFYWAFYYNDSFSMIGASAQSVSAGDTTSWRFENF